MTKTVRLKEQCILIKDKKYGINIRKWCAEHEEYVENALEGDLPAEEYERLVRIHEKKLGYLMHERLIHLIVMSLIAILVIFALALIVFAPDTIMVSGPLFLIAFILLAFYIRHYFFLENTVQRWYTLMDK